MNADERRQEPPVRPVPPPLRDVRESDSRPWRRRLEADGPAFQGGQGRSAEEVEISALVACVCFLGMAAILLIVWLAGC